MGVTILKLVVIFSAILVYHETASIQSSEEGHFNFEKQYQLQNESIVKSIKDKYGSIYDCVDFYKQPAFNHPSLKGHNFHHEMTPKFALGDQQRVTKSCPTCQENSTLFRSMSLEGGGCPTGTVPIKRISKSDFIQMNKFTKDYATRIKTNKIQPQPGTHYAILQTNSDPSQVKYHGVRGIFNVYHLSVGTSQYSSGEIIIQNEEESKVYELGGRLDNCIALIPCVLDLWSQVKKYQLIGDSKRGGIQKIITVIVYQDVKDGNWWLQIDKLVVGFWPRQIFKKLGNGATYIAVGGEAYSPSGQRLPPMGNGYYPVEDVNLSAYCSNLTVLDANHQWIDPQNTETYVNDNHYGVYDMGQAGWYGRLVYYGGTTLWA